MKAQAGHDCVAGDRDKRWRWVMKMPSRDNPKNADPVETRRVPREEVACKL